MYNPRLLRKFLRDNHGDGYISFLMLCVCILLIFSTMFGILKINTVIRGTSNQIENAADSIISEIKVSSYQQALINGTTEDSFTTYSNMDTLRAMHERLGGTLDIPTQHLTKYDNNDQIVYDIYNVSVQYNGNGTILISFDVDVPVWFNGILLTTDTESYTKTTTVNFKESTD